MPTSRSAAVLTGAGGGEHQLLDLLPAREQAAARRLGVVQQGEQARALALELRRQEQPGVEPIPARAAHCSSMPGTISRRMSW